MFHGSYIAYVSLIERIGDLNLIAYIIHNKDYHF